MTIPNRTIGESLEAQRLHYIMKQLDQLIKVISNIGVTTTTTSTTATP